MLSSLSIIFFSLAGACFLRHNQGWWEVVPVCEWAQKHEFLYFIWLCSSRIHTRLVQNLFILITFQINLVFPFRKFPFHLFSLMESPDAWMKGFVFKGIFEGPHHADVLQLFLSCELVILCFRWSPLAFSLVFPVTETVTCIFFCLLNMVTEWWLQEPAVFKNYLRALNAWNPWEGMASELLCLMPSSQENHSSDKAFKLSFPGS